MFGRKPPAGSGESSSSTTAPAQFQSAAQRPATPVAPARPASMGDGDGLPPRPMTPAQPVSAPGQIRRPAEPIRTEAPRDLRKLIVGRDITLSGEIAACDHLIVEGTVEASVKECHRLEVAETGLFKGAVEISEAEIAGRFEGQITVQGRLSVRSTGRIEGKIQYGELAVDAGGTLDGEVHGNSKAKAKEKEKEKPVAEAPLLDQPAATETASA
ncbi:MAG TPA: polymer-forming cytoskeletal protein [Alphaproteobacteria bacterium]|nr:polymer-forming cytoskeletal protein [Alphaproteobacteria bacterium]